MKQTVMSQGPQGLRCRSHRAARMRRRRHARKHAVTDVRGSQDQRSDRAEFAGGSSFESIGVPAAKDLPSLTRFP